MDGYRENTYRANDGLSLSYREYGSPDALSVPVLCLHGLTRSAQDFHDLAMHLAVERHVIVPDFRGRGGSQYDSDYANYRPPTYARDILVLLEQLEVDRVVLIGTSLGGIVSMVIGAMRPEVLAGVVLNDIGPELDPAGLNRISSYAGRQKEPKTWDDAVANVKQSSGVCFPDFGESDWLDFAHRLYKEDEAGNPVTNYDPNIGRAMREAEPGGDMWKLYEGFGDLPVLVIRGEISDLLSAEVQERMVSGLPRARGATIPRKGHTPLLDEPESLAAIDQLLEEVSL